MTETIRKKEYYSEIVSGAVATDIRQSLSGIITIGIYDDKNSRLRTIIVFPPLDECPIEIVVQEG